MRNKILAPSPYQGEGWGEVLQGFLHSLRSTRRYIMPRSQFVGILIQ
ncbi:hypothetical protein [Nostoc sp.]